MYLRKRADDRVETIDEDGEKAWARIRTGEVFRVSRSRSLPEMRLFWSMLTKVAAATEWETPERLLVALKVRLGRYDPVRMRDGTIVPAVHSISFSEMEHGEFQKFKEDALRIIGTEVLPGTDPMAMLDEMEAA